jgi:hypothetical protein
MVTGLHKIFVTLLLLATSSVGAQNLFCSLTPPLKISSITQNTSDGELLLSIETIDPRGTPQLIAVSIPPGETRFIRHHSQGGWAFAIHVQEDQRHRTVKVSTQAWCDGRVRGFDETVVPIQVVHDRT